MSGPLVSVVVPAFRAEACIGEMIESVLAQSMGDLELVICDDGSEDGTAAIVLAYADPRIRLLRSERNIGPGAARDMAIAASRGRWLAVIDADDAWRPDRLERLLGIAGTDTDVMVFDNIMVCHHSESGGMIPWTPLRRTGAFGTRGRARDVALTEYIRSDRLLIKPLLPAAVVRHAGLLHSDRRFGEDAEFFIKLGMHGVRMRYLPEALYLYRATPGSATATAAGHHLMRECIEACAGYPQASPEIRAALDAKSRNLATHEALYAVAESLRQRRLLHAVKLVVGQPSLVVRGFPPMLRRASRLLHGKLRGGRGR